MGLEGGPRLMKIALIVFNTLVLVAGGETIGIGFWSLLVSDYGARDLASITGSSLYEAACIVIIVGGCVAAAVSLIGCCGAISESRWLLATYFSILILLLMVFSSGAVVGFTYHDDLEEELEKEMTETLKERYGNNTSTNYKNQDVTVVWNKIQRKLKCCGVSGGLTGTSSWFMWQESYWFKDQIQFEKDLVPSSCCDSEDYTFIQCQRINTDNTRPPQTYVTGISTENPALYSDGCLEKLKDEIEDHILAIAVSAVVVLVVNLLCIMFAICVFMQIGKQSMVV